jgi:hypothetical protein
MLRALLITTNRDLSVARPPRGRQQLAVPAELSLVRLSGGLHAPPLTDHLAAQASSQ